MKVKILVTLIILLAGLGQLFAIEEFQFTIRPNEEKCYQQEDVDNDVVVLLEYKPSNSPLTQLQIKLYTQVNGDNPIWSQDAVTSGTYAFTTDSRGDISVCFTDKLKPGMHASQSPRKVKFSIKVGAEAKDYNGIAKKDDLKPIEVEIMKLEDLVSEINSDMKYFRNREIRMRDTNESTNTRILWFSGFSMTILLLLGVGQIVYLKQFFHQKKLI